eukprot:8099121-Pyramimonas_sp.AAC.1
MPYPRLSPFAAWWRLVTQVFAELGKFQSASYRRTTLPLCEKLAEQGGEFTDASAQPWVTLLWTAPSLSLAFGGARQPC